jgi:hypothetical protein
MLTDKQERDEIVKQVAKQFRVRSKAILSRDRHAPIAEARQMAMVIMFLRGLSYSATARLFGRKHGAVLHAKAALEQRLSFCKVTKGRWQAVKHLATYQPDGSTSSVWRPRAELQPQAGGRPRHIGLSLGAKLAQAKHLAQVVADNRPRADIEAAVEAISDLKFRQACRRMLELDKEDKQ